MEGYESKLRLVINEDSPKLKSLKDLCRSAILKCTCVSLKHVLRVGKLPLPLVVKDYVSTFRIPDDFDLNGTFMDYNFNFPYHLHHKTHQIHPAVCQLDGSKVLIKVFRNWKETLGACEMCGTEEFTANKPKECVHAFDSLEKWRTLEHSNLMNCLASFVDDSSDILGYVLEFPIMNIQNYVYQLSLTNNQLPEYLAWETFVKLTSVFLFLEMKGVFAWDLCLPDHIVLNEQGEIMLENMLLYLPSKHKGIQYPPQLRPHIIPPELQFGGRAVPQTVVWGIGAIVKELTAPIPSILLHGNLKYSIPHVRKARSHYSKQLQSIISSCTMLNPTQRLSLSKLHYSAKKIQKSLIGDYHGPADFLTCLNSE